MSLSFSDDWLALREPHDHASRAPAITAAATTFLSARAFPLLVDLACGRGSNFRYLQGRVPTDTRWRLIDQDATLLDAAAAQLGDTPAELRQLDLRSDALAAGIAGADLVAAAALIDLVSVGWLDRLAQAAEATGAALLITGSVDGRIGWQPAHSADATMARAYATHQSRDKGFGGALGPRAPSQLAALLNERGWEVVTAPGDWEAIADTRLQTAYLDGFLVALSETDLAPAEVDVWAGFRREALAAGVSRLSVGHLDLFARPPR